MDHTLLDLPQPGLGVGWIGGVLLVDGHNELLHSDWGVPVADLAGVVQHYLTQFYP